MSASTPDLAGALDLAGAQPCAGPDCEVLVLPRRAVRALGEGRPASVRERTARGLCPPCYRRAERSGDLVDYPRVYRRHADVVEDVEVLRQRGLALDQVAEALGLSLRQVQRHLAQARAGAA